MPKLTPEEAALRMVINQDLIIARHIAAAENPTNQMIRVIQQAQALNPGAIDIVRICTELKHPIEVRPEEPKRASAECVKKLKAKFK